MYVYNCVSTYVYISICIRLITHMCLCCRFTLHKVVKAAVSSGCTS